MEKQLQRHFKAGLARTKSKRGALMEVVFFEWAIQWTAVALTEASGGMQREAVRWFRRICARARTHQVAKVPRRFDVRKHGSAAPKCSSKVLIVCDEDHSSCRIKSVQFILGHNVDIL
jgi:hypothetical protein